MEVMRKAQKRKATSQTQEQKPHSPLEAHKTYGGQEL